MRQNIKLIKVSNKNNNKLMKILESPLKGRIKNTLRTPSNEKSNQNKLSKKSPVKRTKTFSISENNAKIKFKNKIKTTKTNIKNNIRNVKIHTIQCSTDIYSEYNKENKKDEIKIFKHEAGRASNFHKEMKDKDINKMKHIFKKPSFKRTIIVDNEGNNNINLKFGHINDSKNGNKNKLENKDNKKIQIEEIKKELVKEDNYNFIKDYYNSPGFFENISSSEKTSLFADSPCTNNQLTIKKINSNKKFKNIQNDNKESNCSVFGFGDEISNIENKNKGKFADVEQLINLFFTGIEKLKQKFLNKEGTINPGYINENGDMKVSNESGVDVGIKSAPNIHNILKEKEQNDVILIKKCNTIKEEKNFSNQSTNDTLSFSVNLENGFKYSFIGSFVYDNFFQSFINDPKINNNLNNKDNIFLEKNVDTLNNEENMELNNNFDETQLGIEDINKKLLKARTINPHFFSNRLILNENEGDNQGLKSKDIKDENIYNKCEIF